MSRHDVVKRHDFRSAMESKEKLSSMKSVRFDGIYTGKEAEVCHGGGCVHIYAYTPVFVGCKHLQALQLNPSRTGRTLGTQKGHKHFIGISLPYWVSL